jgi:hypothetical protein
MKRSMSILISATLVAVLAACNGSTGGLGSVPSLVPTASADPGGPDFTPAPSATPTPSTNPSTEPSDAPSAAPTPPSSPGETMIVRAYFVLGGEPGSVGLVPVLRVVPKSAAVATAAMNAVLAGPSDDEGGG